MRRLSMLLATVALSAPVAASAATVSVNDPAGDALPRYDVVHVVATNSSKGISSWVTFTDLKGSGEVLEFYYGQAADIELTYGMHVWRQHGKVHAVLLKLDANGTNPHRCKRAVGTWNQTTDVVHTFVPASCMQGIVYHPLHILMRTSPPHALASSDELAFFKVPRH